VVERRSFAQGRWDLPRHISHVAQLFSLGGREFYGYSRHSIYLRSSFRSWWRFDRVLVAALGYLVEHCRTGSFSHGDFSCIIWSEVLGVSHRFVAVLILTF